MSASIPFPLSDAEIDKMEEGLPCPVCMRRAIAELEPMLLAYESAATDEKSKIAPR